MKNVFKVLGIIVLVAVIGFSMVSCGDDDDSDGGGAGGGGGGAGGGGGNNTVTQPTNTLTDAEALGRWLVSQPSNYNNPYTIKFNGDDIGELGRWLKGGAKNKYINLDLSGSTATTIPDNAFYENNRGYYGLLSIIIPNTVTSIGQNAFTLTGLISVTIPNGNIVGGAFSKCEDLKSVTIKSGVTKIGNRAFYDCGLLESVTFEEGSNIADADFGNDVFYYVHWALGNVDGNALKTAYKTGGAGTYKRTDSGPVWTKQ